MFRLPSRQIFKALRSSVPSPLLSQARSPLRLFSYSINATPVLFSRPLSYDTLTRRFSSYPNPRGFFVDGSRQKARNRGEFTDIHDIGGANPKDYDVLITDINDEKLRTEIADVVGIQYLAKATEADANNPVEVGHGYVYGRNLRTIFPCVVSHEEKAHWVFFTVDSGCPLTYISAQASKLLGITRTEQATTVKIAGYHHPVFISPKYSHFTEVNLLGVDFLNSFYISPWYDYDNQKVKLYFFAKKWKVMPNL